MRFTKYTLSILMAILAIAFINIAKASDTPSPVSGEHESETFAIEVSGQIPGFTQAQLSAYLARKLQEENLIPLRFVEGVTGSENFPNRVVWLFKTLHKVTKSRGFMGSPGSTNSITYIKAEVKLYIKGAYQMTMDTHPSVSNGADDKVLSDMVHNAAHVLFVENKPDMQ
jgi:hypothetical protein